MNEAILTNPAREAGRAKARGVAVTVYMLLMAVNLLSYVFLMNSAAGISSIPVPVWILRLASGALAVWLGRLWKDRGFQILAAYFLLFFFRFFIPHPDSLFSAEASESVLSAVWLFAACYGMGRILDRDTLKRCLFICAAVWIAWMTMLSCVAVYTVWTDNTMFLPNGTFIGLYDFEHNRLSMIYVATTSGALLSLSFMCTLIIQSSMRQRILKILLAIPALVLLLVLALSDSRTAIISASAGIGVFAFSAVVCASVRKKPGTDGRKKWKTLAVGTVVMIAAFACSVFIIMEITPLFNQLKIRGLIPKAYAEQGTIEVVHRGFEGSRVLTGRLELYKEILHYLKNHPLALLVGESKVSPLKGISGSYAHCHSIYLQVLLESGIPGLGLFLVFIMRSCVFGFRAIFDDKQPLWIRLLPVVLVSLLVGDLAECFTWLRSSQCLMSAAFFLGAGILSARARNVEREGQ